MLPWDSFSNENSKRRVGHKPKQAKKKKKECPLLEEIEFLWRN